MIPMLRRSACLTSKLASCMTHLWPSWVNQRRFYSFRWILFHASILEWYDSCSNNSESIRGSGRFEHAWEIHQWTRSRRLLKVAFDTSSIPYLNQRIYWLRCACVLISLWKMMPHTNCLNFCPHVECGLSRSRVLSALRISLISSSQLNNLAWHTFTLLSSCWTIHVSFAATFSSFVRRSAKSWLQE